MDAVVRRIAAAFEASGMEQKELALRSGLPQSTLNQILRKGSGTFANVAKLAKALRLSVDDLLEDDAPVSSPITPYDANATYRSLVDALEDMPKDDRQEVLRFMLWMMKRMGAHASLEDVRKITSHSEKPDNVAAFPAKTVPEWTPEFPVHPLDFNDAGDTDFPLEYHSIEEEDLDEVGGGDPVMPTKLLSSREVRTGKLRTVRVRSNDVAPYREGWKLAIDVTQQDPSLIPDKKAIVAYRKDKGTIIGRIYHVGTRNLLRKDGDERGIDLSEGYQIVGHVDHVAYWKDEIPDDATKNGK